LGLEGAFVRVLAFGVLSRQGLRFWPKRIAKCKAQIENFKMIKSLPISFHPELLFPLKIGSQFVIPAEAGIQFKKVMKKPYTFLLSKLYGVPAFAGMTTLFLIPPRSPRGRGIIWVYEMNLHFEFCNFQF
jgi:hypothetical protein